MRKNQVGIRIERFGEAVPEKYPNDTQCIEVYCDDHHSIYNALSKAYALCINELSEYEQLCSRSDVYTNEFSRSPKDVHAVEAKGKNQYEQCVELQYRDKSIKLMEDQVWLYEHIQEVVELITRSEDVNHQKAKLMEKYNLNELQVKQIMRTRLDMLSNDEYLLNAAKLRLEKEDLEKKSSQYRKIKYRETAKAIADLRTYLLLAENLQEVMHLMQEAESAQNFVEKLHDQFDISRHEASVFQYCQLSDFRKDKREKNRKKLEELEERLDFYKD